LRTRLHQALAFIAVSTASATASSPVLSADLPPAPLPLAYQQAPQPPQNVRVVQGAIEQSNVNAVAEMARMIEITRAYESIAGLLQQQATMRASALDKLAAVPT